MTLRYTGTYTRTRYYGSTEPRLVTEVYLDVLDAGTRAVLGAIWQGYDEYAALSPPSFPKMRVAVEIAREAMANLVVGSEHLHTSACEAGRADCPIFEAGEECAKETVGEWIDLSDFHQEFP